MGLFVFLACFVFGFLVSPWFLCFVTLIVLALCFVGLIVTCGVMLVFAFCCG